MENHTLNINDLRYVYNVIMGDEEETTLGDLMNSVGQVTINANLGELNHGNGTINDGVVTYTPNPD